MTGSKALAIPINFPRNPSTLPPSFSSCEIALPLSRQSPWSLFRIIPRRQRCLRGRRRNERRSIQQRKSEYVHPVRTDRGGQCH